jgi:hypothetical protein
MAAASGGTAGPGPTTADQSPLGASGVPSVNLDLTKQPPPNGTKPIAQAKGNNWAWREGERWQTSVVRAIRLQCYVDRWVILPENSNQKAIIIPMEATPIDRAEKLAAAVGERVDSWGVAMSGGHWSPQLKVEVAPDADWRFNQLKRLMQGSGIPVEHSGSFTPKIAVPPQRTKQKATIR